MSDEPEDFDFDRLIPADVPVKYQGKTYALRPASEGIIIQFRAMQYSNPRVVDGRVTASMERVVESQSYLVHGCLFDGDRRVPWETVKTWPDLVIQKLFDRCMDMNHLRAKEDEAALRKQIAEAQKKLDALRNGHTETSEEETAKNLPGSSEDISG